MCLGPAQYEEVGGTDVESWNIQSVQTSGGQDGLWVG
jgi:hypothetical protein